MRGGDEIQNLVQVQCSMLVEYPIAHSDLGIERRRTIDTEYSEESRNTAEKGVQSEPHVTEHYGTARNPRRALWVPVRQHVQMVARRAHFHTAVYGELGGHAPEDIRIILLDLQDLIH